MIEIINFKKHSDSPNMPWFSRSTHFSLARLSLTPHNGESDPLFKGLSFL